MPYSIKGYEVPKRLKSDKFATKNWLPKFVAKPVFGKPLAPTEDEWAAIKSGVVTGDTAMDAVVDWMFETNPGARKKLFDQALMKGIDTLDNPPDVLRRFFDKIDCDPEWLDRELMEEGAKVSHHSGDVGFYVLRDMALMGGYALFNSMNQTLEAAGSLTKDTKLRLGETSKWAIDVTEPHGMERFGEGFITTIRVRMVHALVRRGLLKKDSWDSAKWGVPINQVDMTATYLAFGPVSLLGARLFGVPVLLKESKAFMHLWRYVGWLSGVEEERLAITERDGLRKLYHTFLTHALPDEKIGVLGEALKAEPLERFVPEYKDHPHMASLRRKYLYHQHLSNSSLILGPLQRRRLGIPFYALPWYPLMSAPARFIVLTYYRLRGGEVWDEYTQKSRQGQKDLLNAFFGERQKDILKPEKDHPAHVA